jgi:hypothetical protein
VGEANVSAQAGGKRQCAQQQESDSKRFHRPSHSGADEMASAGLMTSGSERITTFVAVAFCCTFRLPD